MTRGIWDENETRVQLAKIPALTFYKDEPTVARRTPAIPQLVCVGKPCKLYQPEVVRCVNIGGNGVDVDWKVSRGNMASSIIGLLCLLSV